MSPDDIPIIPQSRPKRCQRRTGIDTGGGPGGSRGRGEASPALTPLGKGGRASGRPEIPCGCCLSVPRRERQHRRGSRARSPGKEPAGGRGAGTRALPCPGGQPLSERTLLHRITPAQAAGSGATSRGPGPAPPRSVSRCLRSPMLVVTDACGHCRLRSVPFARSRWKRSRTRGGFIPDPRLADGAAVPALRGAAPMVKSPEFNGFERISKGDGRR